MLRSPRALARPLALAGLAGLIGLFLLVPLAPASAATVNVSIVNFTYNPNPVTITAGDTVLWTQNGAAPHTVTADDNSFTSGTMSTGGTFSQTFTTPGTIRYYCTIHGAPNGVGMSGTIVVQATQTTSSTTTTTTPAATTTTAAAPSQDTTTTTVAASTTTTPTIAAASSGSDAAVLSAGAGQSGQALAATGSRYAGALAAIGVALVLTGAYVVWEIRRMGDADGS